MTAYKTAATDLYFLGYTPQLLAGAWVGCDDPFLKIRWTYGGNEMAMPEFAYFMQKVYADKRLGIDPKAEFQRPAELDNNPIYADQNFAAIVQQGEGSEFSEDQGNGDAGDYEGSELLAPVESDFSKDAFKDLNQVKDKGGETDKKEILKTDTKVKADSIKTTDKKDPKAVMPPAIKVPDDKNKKVVKPPAKTVNDY